MLNIKTIARQALAVLGVVGVLGFAAGSASAAQPPVAGGPTLSAPAHARVMRHEHRHALRHVRHHRHHHHHRTHRAAQGR